MNDSGKGHTGVFIAAAVATLITAGFLALLFSPNSGPTIVSEEAERAVVEDRIEEENFFLYFAEGDTAFLTSEERTVSTARDPWQLGRKIIAALLSGPERGNARTLPIGTELRAFYITERKVAVVDFSSGILKEPKGAAAELLTIYSVVNSLAVNISEIDAVQILIEGKPAETLAGHIDISKALTPDMLMVR